MKTAMQELIESVGRMAQGLNEDELFDYFNKRAKELLEAEKQQIKGAYMSGKHDSGIDKKYSSEDYYQQTFNQE